MFVYVSVSKTGGIDFPVTLKTVVIVPNEELSLTFSGWGASLVFFCKNTKSYFKGVNSPFSV